MTAAEDKPSNGNHGARNCEPFYRSPPDLPWLSCALPPEVPVNGRDWRRRRQQAAIARAVSNPAGAVRFAFGSMGSKLQKTAPGLDEPSWRHDSSATACSTWP
jgi:hypothetical protein